MLIENLKMALSSLIANKMRSLLTMLGMIIGIGSVILTTSLGDTLRKAFSDIFANLGVSQAFIYVHMEEPGANDWFSLMISPPIGKPSRRSWSILTATTGRTVISGQNQAMPMSP